MPDPSSTTARRFIDPRLISIYPKQYDGINLKNHDKTNPTVFAPPPKNLKINTTIESNPPITNVKK